jgi:hypothetical protein
MGEHSLRRGSRRGGEVAYWPTLQTVSSPADTGTGYGLGGGLALRPRREEVGIGRLSWIAHARHASCARGGVAPAPAGLRRSHVCYSSAHHRQVVDWEHIRRATPKSARAAVRKLHRRARRMPEDDQVFFCPKGIVPKTVTRGCGACELGTGMALPSFAPTLAVVAALAWRRRSRSRRRETPENPR